MKSFSCLLAALLIHLSLQGQNLLTSVMFPDTLRSDVDSLFIDSPMWDQTLRLSIPADDTLDWGTYGYKGVYFTVWTDLDTMTIPNVNHPEEQRIVLPVKTNTDLATLILRFQPTPSDFSKDFVSKNERKISFEIPEVYELANIILYLTSCSTQTGNHPSTEYSRRLEEHFSGMRNHRLISTLNNLCAKDFWDTYYGFRENSICISFDGEGNLNYDTPYKNVMRDNTRARGGYFRNLLFLVQDFVNQSDFRAFYAANSSYYNQLIERQEELLNVNEMWKWLEHEFPQKMNAYKIVFSPLIGGSHSTQKFIKGFFNSPSFTECIMFIGSTEYLDDDLQASEKLKEGLMSGIVFTEIDHNYVNPTTDKHLKAVKKLMKDKDFWATVAAQENYRSEYAIFNEYMTHSLFCLFVQENYETEISQKVISKRIQLMNRRGYPKFEQFNRILIQRMMDNPSSTYEEFASIIEDMYELK